MSIAKWLLAKKLSGGGSPFPPVIKRVTGNPVEFTDGADAPLVKCVTEIQGSQDLHGYDKPWVGGAGKNKCIQTVSGVKTRNSSLTWVGDSTTLNGVTFTILSDNAGNVIGYNVNGTASELCTFSCDDDTYVASESVIVNGRPQGADGCSIDVWRSGSIIGKDTGSGVTVSAGRCALSISVARGTTVDNKVFHPMIRLSTVTDPTFAPYSNICPITAYTEGEIEVSDGDGNITTHTTTYPSAIFRGSEDVVNGEVTVQKIKWTRNSSTMNNSEAYPGWNDSGLADIIGHGQTGRITAIMSIGSIYGVNTTGSMDTLFLPTDTYGLSQTEWIALAVDVDIIIELATPTTSSVTPTNLPIKSLSGYNHIESSTGDMEVDYITDAYQNFVDTTERAIPSTRKGGVKAFDIFKTLDEPKKPEVSAEESKPEEKETEEGAKK